MSDTPRTDAEWELQCGSVQSWYRSAEGMKEFARQLERELVAVTEERDELLSEIKDLRNFKRTKLLDILEPNWRESSANDE